MDDLGSDRGREAETGAEAEAGETYAFVQEVKGTAVTRDGLNGDVRPNFGTPKKTRRKARRPQHTTQHNRGWLPKPQCRRARGAKTRDHPGQDRVKVPSGRKAKASKSASAPSSGGAERIASISTGISLAFSFYRLQQHATDPALGEPGPPDAQVPNPLYYVEHPPQSCHMGLWALQMLWEHKRIPRFQL